MLDQFVELKHDSNGNPIRPDLSFYKMDGRPDMRRLAGLRTCSCCDFFVAGISSILFVEETDLLRFIRDSKDSVNYLDNNDKEDFVRKKILHENRSKVYGAMLVLCRLALYHSEVKSLIQDKTHVFWLVVSGDISNEDKVYFDNLKIYLENSFKSELGSLAFSAVKVLPLDKLQEQLSSIQ